MFRKLFENNIIYCGNQYFCYLCMSVQSSMENTLNHINEKEHQMLKHNQVMLGTYREKQYETFLRDKMAIVTLNMFMCLYCKEVMTCIKEVTKHVTKEKHINRLQNECIDFNSNTSKDGIQIEAITLRIQKKKIRQINLFNAKCALLQNTRATNEQDKPFKVIKIIYDYPNDVFEPFIKNAIIVVDSHRLICMLCYRCFKTPTDIQNHFTSNIVKHKFKNEKIMLELNKNENKNIQDYCVSSDVIIKATELNLPEIQYESSQSIKFILPISTKIEEEQNTCNKIVVHNSEDHISEHVKLDIAAMKDKSKENEYNNKNIDSLIDNKKEELNVVQATILPKETITKMKQLNLGTDKKDKNISKKQYNKFLHHGIIYNSDTYFCTLCKYNSSSLQDILLHIKGASHKNIMKSGKCILSIKKITDTNIKLLTNSEHNVEQLTDNDDNSKLQNENENCSYCCELCNLQIDVDHLLEHINTATHKRNISSMNMKINIVLYKCLCCKSIIQGLNSLIKHLCLKTHVYNLISISKDGTFPLCNILIPLGDNKSTHIIEKDHIFCNTKLAQLSNVIRNGISYYCSLCNSNLYSEKSISDHFKSKKHILNIQEQIKYICQINKKECYIVDNNLISDQCDNISNLDKRDLKVKVIDTDFILPDSVYRDVIKHLSESPFLPKFSSCTKYKEKTLERLNKEYYKTYLQIEEEMYTLNKQKLYNTEFHFKLLTRYNDTHLYCLVCNTKISKVIYLLYEHICLKSHIENYETERQKDAKGLLSQHMKQTSMNLIKCFPCISSFSDQLLIEAHINRRTHKKNYKQSCTIIDNFYNCILQDFANLWYNIQRFSCTLCKTGFKYKIEFIEHVIAKHEQPLKNYIFDFCIPCATLWLGNINCYEAHCNDIMHKYLVKSKDFVVADLPKCIKELLTQVDKTVDVLIEQTQILLDDNIQQEVTQSLENSMKVSFPSVKAFLFGSRFTGLGNASSDIDIYLNCGDIDYKNKTHYITSYFKSIKQILCKEDEWEVKEILEETRTPIMKVIYKRTVPCDISITNGLCVENSKLIRSFIDAYSPCKQLILFVKKWFSCFDLSGRHGFTSYALVWMVIFYLQTESHLPSVATLIKEQNESRTICGWETGVAQPKSNNESVQSVSTLLLSFFEFYGKFDYQHLIICPLMGNTLPKTMFSEPEKLPEEMKPYINHLRSEKPEYFRIDSPLCIQDPFDLSHNLTKAVNSITLKYIKQYCQQSASVMHSTI
ncbi:uncharacterized protein LOC143186646 [Calliopsis andreniformis]|uniref:uncharacterized protein LOC143186646 n=1 Tax=Calliopsis andreniformis TaxID=337506 RepID=UPI003FCE5A0C